MAATEPIPTAALFATFGLLLAISVLFSRATERIHVPVALVFLLVGTVAGMAIPFQDYRFAFRLGTAALILILFDGGLNTPVGDVRRVLPPAALLATVGVVATAGLVAACAHAIGFAWRDAFLLGAVVSSTDAAAVFSVLRGSGVLPRWRVGLTLEVESGLNDPVAVILTGLITAYALGAAAAEPLAVAGHVGLEIVVGTAMGFGVGRLARYVTARVRLVSGGLYPALTLAAAFLAFALATLSAGSGFLAVYIAALVVGGGHLPYRGALLRVHDALAWLGQIAMFLVLGLLVHPSRVLGVAWQGVVLALVLAVVARPLVVALCLAPFAYTARDTLFVGWAGLRGAVPIILATIPVLAGVPGAERVFDVVFVIVVVNALIPGATVARVMRALGLEAVESPAPQAVLHVESARPLNGELLTFYVDESLAVAGVPLADLPFPAGAAATLIVRGRDLVAPRGTTTLEPGDHVFVITSTEDRPFIELMFGRPEGE